MALRIEYIILISLTIVALFIFMEKPTSIEMVESNSSKEVYFRNFVLLEINSEGIANRLKAREGIKYKESFELSDINITYQKSHTLSAKRGKYIQDFIHLEGDVRLQRDDGFNFWTEDLSYKVKEKVAYTERKFILYMNGSRVSGKKLHYSLESKEVSADNVSATIDYRESI